MEQEIIVIDGMEYMPVVDRKEKEVTGDYVVVRTRSAGVHAGYLQTPIGEQVTLSRSRRIYYWDGAASVSQLAMEGTTKPDNCKFPCEVITQHLMEVIEVIPTTRAARVSIQSVPVWSA